MDIAERTTIKQDIFKKQNCSYLDDSFHWLSVVCRCISDTIAIQALTLLVVPVCYSIFTAVQGTYINCRFPKFDWDNEMVVVKQSISVILSGVIGMICIAVPALLHWFLDVSLIKALWGMAAILIVLSVILYFKACSRKII